MFLLPFILGLLATEPPGSAPPGRSGNPAAEAVDKEVGNLRERVQDRQDPHGQSQAAILLVQSGEAGAEKVIHQGLRKPENEEMFFALAAAVRQRQDRRFFEDLIASLKANKPRIRQAVAETLAVLPEPALVQRLEKVAKNPKLELRVRQTAVWTLGRSGRQDAARVLVEMLGDPSEDLRRIAIGALTDLTGQHYGSDIGRWRVWWSRHQNLTSEQWLVLRLAFQTSRALRLEGELVRARAHVVRLHQQIYTRLPVAERFTHLQTLLDQEDPAVRALVVVWSLELLPAADANRQRLLARVLLHLSYDNSAEVQRTAVLGLGRMTDPSAAARLHQLLKLGTPPVRAAAARALALQARGATAEARARQKEVIPALQKALDDKALEVVVEAAEALGTLGAPEAGPVLTGLLRHPSEHVRQTAAQALERMADPSLLDGLLKGLEDPSVTVRFSLVGALGRAAGSVDLARSENGVGTRALTSEQRKRLLARLEVLLRRDADAGVRSRAATVIGEHAGPTHLESLWRVVQTGAEGRVQEKAWDAFIEILARAGDVKLLEKWSAQMAESHHGSRQVMLLARIYARWDQRAGMKEMATRALEGLVQAQIDLGKWSAATPLVQNLLSRNDGSEAARNRCMHWLLQIGELAVKEGNRGEALRVVQEARAYLPRGDKLTEAFDRLEKRASRKN